MKNTLKAILAIFFVLFIASCKEEKKPISTFFVLFIASCKEEKKPISTLPSPMEEIDTTNIKKSLLREVKNFIDKHPKTDAFILYNIERYKVNKGYDNTCIGCRIYFNEVYCIREAYSWHFGDGEFIIRRNYPHRYFTINGKIVFVPSNDDCPLDKQYFLLYDLKDSCEKADFPFDGDSIYEYTSREFVPSVVEKVKSSIKFDPPILK